MIKRFEVLLRNFPSEYDRCEVVHAHSKSEAESLAKMKPVFAKDGSVTAEERTTLRLFKRLTA